MVLLKKIGLLCLALLLLINSASAVAHISISIDPIFHEGDVVKFSYRFISLQEEIIKYTAGVKCDNIPEALLEMKEAQIKANELFYDEYTYGEIDQSFERGDCIAFVSVLEPYDLYEEEQFRVETDPSFTLKLRICKDQSCSEKSKVFIQNENIYLDYISEVDNPSITATLTYPDRTTKQLTLPTSIKAEQIGTHTLDMVVSKEGYKTMSVKEQFGVIEQEANILDVSVCNANGICDNQENYQNCPQDCAYPADKSSKKTTYLATILITIIVLFLVFLIIIISVKIFKIIRRKRFGKIEGIKKLEARKKGIDLKKLELKKDFQKELKEKERTFKKKKRFLDKLSWRKKKTSGKEQEVLGRKLKHDRKVLSGKKLEIKKELGKKFETKRKLLKFKETGLEKEKKVVRDKSKN